ncbi:hypothetical protein PENTCL1PPCAC_2924, partial [Pristionchus entomophagus]
HTHPTPPPAQVAIETTTMPSLTTLTLTLPPIPKWDPPAFTARGGPTTRRTTTPTTTNPPTPTTATTTTVTYRPRPRPSEPLTYPTNPPPTITTTTTTTYPTRRTTTTTQRPRYTTTTQSSYYPSPSYPTPPPTYATRPTTTTTRWTTYPTTTTQSTYPSPSYPTPPPVYTTTQSSYYPSPSYPTPPPAYPTTTRTSYPSSYYPSPSYPSPSYPSPSYPSSSYPSPSYPSPTSFPAPYDSYSARPYPSTTTPRPSPPPPYPESYTRHGQIPHDPKQEGGPPDSPAWLDGIHRPAVPDNGVQQSQQYSSPPRYMYKPGEEESYTSTTVASEPFTRSYVGNMIDIIGPLILPDQPDPLLGYVTKEELEKAVKENKLPKESFGEPNDLVIDEAHLPPGAGYQYILNQMRAKAAAFLQRLYNAAALKQRLRAA